MKKLLIYLAILLLLTACQDPRALRSYSQGIQWMYGPYGSSYEAPLPSRYLMRNRQAIERFNRAIEIAPNFLEAIYKRGLSHLYIRDWSLAESDFVFLSDKIEYSLLALEHLAEIYVKTKRYNDAERVTEELFKRVDLYSNELKYSRRRQIVQNKLDYEIATQNFRHAAQTLSSFKNLSLRVDSRVSHNSTIMAELLILAHDYDQARSSLQEIQSKRYKAHKNEDIQWIKMVLDILQSGEVDWVNIQWTTQTRSKPDLLYRNLNQLIEDQLMLEKLRQVYLGRYTEDD